MNGLSLQHLTASYGAEDIVEDVSFEVRPQEDLVLMGISGSGKTTLLLTILGIITPKTGKILLNGKEIQALPIEERNIGYLPQDYGLFPHLNVIENVSYGLLVRGIPRKERFEKAREMLELVDLKGYDTRKVRELSGGQRQRVGLARALAIDPEMLLLDEPLSSIDQITKFEVATHLKNLFSKLKIPIILVTHNNDDARFLAKRLAIMVDGKIEQVGTTVEVLANPKTQTVRRLLAPFEGS